MVTPNTIINVYFQVLFDKTITICNMILKIEQNDNGTLKTSRCASYNAIKTLYDNHQSIYQNSSRFIDVSTLLSIGLSGSINRISIVLSLKSLISFIKAEKSSKYG